jgi:hydroxymethylbilane synthase
MSTTSKHVKLGTRGSPLALWQADFVTNALKQLHPTLQIERVIIQTQGDVDLQSSLTQIGGTGVFTKAIEQALVNQEIDLAVHSLKDVPSVVHEQTMLAAIPERGPVQDALITLDGASIQQLPPNPRIATGSIRRRAQLLHMRPDAVLCDLRGNIDTRLQKLAQHYHAIVMARAALLRLQKSVPYWEFSTTQMVPAVGQGALGIQILSKNDSLQMLLQSLNHVPSQVAVTAERSLLAALDSGCQFPIGGYAYWEASTLHLHAIVSNFDGTICLRESAQLELPAGSLLENESPLAVQGVLKMARELGQGVAHKLIERGASELLSDYKAC